MHCQIRVRGHLNASWQTWFELEIVHEYAGTTLLSGPISDQSALYGVLLKLRNLSLVLLSLGVSEIEGN